MKVENEGVHRNRYDGHCMKQWIIIPKVVGTLPILRRRSTCRTSSNKTSLMKNDVKDEVPNGTPKTLIPSNGVLNRDGVSKLSYRLEGDHVTHYWGWIEKPIPWNSVWKCSYVHDTIEGGFMMWMSFTINGNRQGGKWLTIKCRALKWIRANSALPKGSPWWVPMANGMIMTLFSQLRWL